VRPIEEFLRHCREQGLDNEEGDCERNIAWHMRHAHVYSGPECFAMAVLCNLEETRRGWVPPRPVIGVMDCWCVTAVAGDLRAALAHLPYDLPWMAFYRVRRGEKRFAFYPTGRLKVLCHTTP
jgi:hypothetical protein